ncbi:site-specific DNA-methyltransferase [Mycoplasmopsis pulmonis]|uniref:site-specific DNA-methyltransferase n=1 Tax=Mycoplasmopsis pulmonis TaxID=2107 RepID=UPI001F1F8215
MANEKEDIKNNAFQYRDRFSRNGWLNMMNERLTLARKLLSDDGIIFVSIDDNEQAYLKVLMDEIFGEENFISNFIWEKNYSSKNNVKFVSVNHDYILCYARNKLFLDKLNRINRTELNNKLYRYNDNDGKGLYRISDLTKNNSKNRFAIEHNGKKYFSKNNGWIYSKEKIDKLIEENKIWFPHNENGIPGLKRYLSEMEGVVSKTILPYQLVGHTDENQRYLDTIISPNDENGEKVFKYPKGTKLIKYLINLYPNKDAKVLDFFAGSGTTGHAVLELNREDGGKRTFTLVTNNENNIAMNVTHERLHRIIQGKSTKGESNFKWLEKNKPFINTNLNIFKIDYFDVSIESANDLSKMIDIFRKSLRDFGVKNSFISEEEIFTKLRSLTSLRK